MVEHSEEGVGFASALHSSRAVAEKAVAKEQGRMQVCAILGTQDSNSEHQLQWAKARECR